MKKKKNSRKIQNNNNGLSLVELIITVAMLAIVGSIIAAFIATSSKTYTRVSAEVDIQEEAQLTVNQIKDLVIDANRAVIFGLEAPTESFTVLDGSVSETDIIDDWVNNQGVAIGTIKKVLVVYNEEYLAATNSYQFPIVKIIYNADEGKLYYAKKTFADLASINISTFGTGGADTHLLSESVTNFQVDLSQIDKSILDLVVNFSSSKVIGEGQSFFATPTINLRNKVIVSEVLTDIYNEAEVVKNSFVNSVTIKKGTAIITSDGLTRGTGASYTGVVDIQFGASTTSSEVVWSITGSAGSTKSTITGTGVLNVAIDEPSSILEVRATSVADPTKYASISIYVADIIRPTSIDIVVTESATNNNLTGVRKTYTATATINYNEGPSKVATASEIRWEMLTSLPAGCSAIENSAGQYVIALTEAGGSNTYTFKSISEVGASLGGAGVEKSKTIIVPPLPYIVQSTPTVTITTSSTVLTRGNSVKLTAAVNDFQSTTIVYTWEIVSAGSVGFDSTAITSLSRISLVQNSSAKQEATLSTDDWLGWNNSYTVQVKVTARDTVNNVSATYVTNFSILPVTMTVTMNNSNSLSKSTAKQFTYTLTNVNVSTLTWSSVSTSFPYSGYNSANGVEYFYSDYFDWSTYTWISALNLNSYLNQSTTGLLDLPNKEFNRGSVSYFYMTTVLTYKGNTVTSNSNRITMQY